MPLFKPNIEKMLAKGDAKGLIKALSYKRDNTVRAAAASALAVIEPPAVEALIKTLRNRDENASVLEAAAQALGQIGDARAIEPLIDRLVAYYSLTASETTVLASALAEIGPPAVEGLVDKLKTKITSSFDSTRDIDFLASALVEIGPPAVEPLIDKLKDESERTREVAAKALGEIGDVRAVEPLIERLEEKHYVREAVVKALGQIGDTRAIEPLIKRLKDNNDVTAARALAQIGDTQAIEPLIEKLKGDPHIDLCIAIAHELGEIGDIRAIEPLIKKLMDDSEDVRRAVAFALGKIGDARAVEPLIEKRRDDSEDVRKAAASALGEIGDARAAEPLIEKLRDDSEYVRSATAQALGQIGDIRAIEPLVDALVEGRVAASICAEALDNLGWRPDMGKAGAFYWVAKSQWDKCVEIGSPAVEPLIESFCEGAAEALGQIGDARAIEPLIEKLTHPLQGWYTRKTAAGALVAMYRGGKLDMQAKHKILAMRKTITKPHSDHESSSDCNFHTDEGIGVKFPI